MTQMILNFNLFGVIKNEVVITTSDFLFPKEITRY